MTVVRRLCRDRAGAAAVELALVLPALLAMLLVIIEVGRMAWTKAALTYAVEEAARCASVRPATCANATAIKQFAADQVGSLNIAADKFTYTTPACGNQVAAEIREGFLLYDVAPSTKWAITARACHA
jgi:Flp pilus assembly protein TadG